MSASNRTSLHLLPRIRPPASLQRPSSGNSSPATEPPGMAPEAVTAPVKERLPSRLCKTCMRGMASRSLPSEYSAMAILSASAPPSDCSMRPLMRGRPGPPVTKLPLSRSSATPLVQLIRDSASTASPSRPTIRASGTTTVDPPWPCLAVMLPTMRPPDMVDAKLRSNLESNGASSVPSLASCAPSSIASVSPAMLSSDPVASALQSLRSKSASERRDPSSRNSARLA